MPAKRKTAPKMKIRKGDRVIVLQGKSRGREGVVLKAMPRRGKVVVEGVNMVKHHDKPKQANQPGGIREQEAPIDVSSVALVAGGAPTRVGFQLEADGSKTRIARRTGGVI